MVRDRQHGPVVELNRIQVTPFPSLTAVQVTLPWYMRCLKVSNAAQRIKMQKVPCILECNTENKGARGVPAVSNAA